VLGAELWLTVLRFFFSKQIWRIRIWSVMWFSFPVLYVHKRNLEF